MSLGAHVGDSDNLFWTNRLNNDVNYVTPVFHDVTASVSYAFSDSTQTGNNSAYSAGIQYDGQKEGQGLRLGAGFFVLNNPDSPTNDLDGATDDDAYGYSSPFVTSPIKHAGVSSQRSAAVGAKYTIGRLTVAGDYSNVQFNYLDNTSLNLNNAEIYSTYNITPKLLGGAAFIYTWGRYTANGAKPNYSQINAGLQYTINQYVDLYLVNIFQKAGGSAQNAWIYSAGELSTNTQNMTVTGFKFKF